MVKNDKQINLNKVLLSLCITGRKKESYLTLNSNTSFQGLPVEHQRCPKILHLISFQHIGTLT
jgi:hypothetical protein